MKSSTDIGKDCARAWEAMPWALQNSATPHQDEWLDHHLAHCASCRAEFAQQSRLRLALSLPTDVSVNADAGLRRLLARIDAPDAQATQRTRGSWITRALVAAVLVQAIGIGVLGVRLWSETAQPAYRTLSQTASPVPAGAIHVVPDDTMKLADWNALLHTLQLQVVGGPNEVGAYTVVTSNPALAGAGALQKLRATHGIRLAEPVATTP